MKKIKWGMFLILMLILSGCFTRPESTLPLEIPLTIINTSNPRTPVKLPDTWTPGPTSSNTPWPDPTATKTRTPRPTPSPTDPPGIEIGGGVIIGEYPIIHTSLVFIREDNGKMALYQITPDDPEPERLLLTDDDIFSPTWSPDGTQLAYLRTNNYQEYLNQDPPADLYLYIAGMEAILTESGKMNISDLAWSRDSTMIAFSGQKINPSGYIYTGKNIYQVDIYSLKTNLVIESALGNVGCSSPSWDPDSEEIVARCRGSNITGVAIAEKDGSRPWFYDIPFDRVVWSPNGGTVLLIGGDPELLIIDAPFLYQRNYFGDLNRLDLYQYHGNLSVQRKNVTGYAWTNELYSRSIIQSKDLIQIIDQHKDKLVSIGGDFAGLDGQISWGPEGYQVAFAYFDGHDTEIGVVDFSRSSFYQLTDNQVDDLMPAWQPIQEQ